MHKISFVAKKEQKLSKSALYYCENLSYSAFMRALRNKDVKVNGKRVNADQSLKIDDVVEIFYKLEQTESFSVIFADNNVLVINKKAGYSSESVFEKIRASFDGARFIHRLDRNTSGIMIFALNPDAETELLRGFKERTFNKLYYATVKGIPKNKQAVVSAYLVKDSDASTVKIFDSEVNGSSFIKTGYKVIKSDGDTSLLEIELFTGKTHQIRAHLAYLGYPIVGDGKYGDNEFNKKKGVKTQMLCAKKLTLNFNNASPLYYLNGKTFALEN